MHKLSTSLRQNCHESTNKPGDITSKHRYNMTRPRKHEYSTHCTSKHVRVTSSTRVDTSATREGDVVPRYSYRMLL